MTKHTPGPWVSSKFGFQVLTGDSWNVICKIEGGAKWEDGRGSYKQEYAWQNQEANARLIAAAPEMLMALKTIALHAPSLDVIGIRELCDEAIAKAEGRTP